MLIALFQILVFPGFLFLSLMALIIEFIDRKVYARFQNRVGPPWFQPLADFIKLIGKETIIPEEADRSMFKLLPVFALASVCTAFFYIPMWSTKPLFYFTGDLIVVLYLLTIPTIVFSLAGWHSTSLYATIGSVRGLTQLFAYEVPLFMALLAQAMLADTWTISGIADFYKANPLLVLINIPAFIVAVISVQGKLERVPFDIPEAETEIVAGTFTEYSGKLLAIFRMAIDIEMVVVSALLASIFFPFYVEGMVIVGFIIFIAKTLVIVFLLTILRTVLARFRIDQMVRFCWLFLVPVALVQILINIIIKGVIL